MSVCKCDECSFFNYCINMDFESVNKRFIIIIIYYISLDILNMVRKYLYKYI